MAFSRSWQGICYTNTQLIFGMKGTYLGEFEEVVLLAVAIRSGEAYGAAVVNEIEQQMGRPVSLGAVHSALNRLQEKGLVKSEMGGISPERGGRRKRLYSVTAYGQRALEEVRQLRNQMWDAIPRTAWS
jgi:DNA-binding PadR family transcriptional regulator